MNCECVAGIADPGCAHIVPRVALINWGTDAGNAIAISDY